MSEGPAHQRIEIELRFGNTLKIAEVSDEPPGYAEITVRFDTFTIKARGNIMYTLPVDKMVAMQVAYVDAQGNPAKVDGDVIWASSDDDIVTVSVDSEDSTIVKVTPAGEVGQVQVTATADADLGDGTRQLITTCDIEVVAGEAVAGSITPLGEPEPVAPHVAPRG